MSAHRHSGNKGPEKDLMTEILDFGPEGEQLPAPDLSERIRKVKEKIAEINERIARLTARLG